MDEQNKPEEEIQEETHFNKKSRTSNAALNVVSGLSYQIVYIISSFIFRTIFIMVLSKEYLGINGLFTNILSVLSLVELGFGSSIVYRMYKPIANSDVSSVAKYMNFYKKIYMVMGMILLVVGLSLTPAIKFLIKDSAEIPADINIYLIYALFVLQSASSYFLVYKTSIFNADQKNYYISLANIVSLVLSTTVKIVILFVLKSYTWTLIAGIIIGVLTNFIMTLIAKKQYPAVFKSKEKLDKEQIKEIKGDVLGLLCHRVGGIAVSSTDNILLSTFIGIGVLGIYSNYSLIIFSVASIMGQLFSTYTASIGNGHELLSKEDYYKVFKNMQFINLAIVSCASIALFTLINPFIEVWLDQSMLLNQTVVIALTVNFFLGQSRHTLIAFTSASGLFRKDKWRPLLEAVVNLIASILLVQYLGVIGIFLGTIISYIAAIYWREPFLVFKNDFDKKPYYFYFWVITFLIITAIISAALYYLFKLFPLNIGYLILRFVIAGIVPILIIIAVTFWSPQCKYLLKCIAELSKKMFNKIKTIVKRKK